MHYLILSFLHSSLTASTACWRAIDLRHIFSCSNACMIRCSLACCISDNSVRNFPSRSLTTTSCHNGIEPQTDYYQHFTCNVTLTKTKCCKCCSTSFYIPGITNNDFLHTKICILTHNPTTKITHTHLNNCHTAVRNGHLLCKAVSVLTTKSNFSIIFNAYRGLESSKEQHSAMWSFKSRNS